MSDIFLENLAKKDTELVYDKNFIQSVFKKAERISSATFYTIDRIEDTFKFKDSPLQIQIYDSIFRTLNIASEMLKCTISTVRRPMIGMISELTRLSALLTIAATSDRVSASHAMLIQHEIDALLEALEHVRTRETNTKVRATNRSLGRTRYQSGEPFSASAMVMGDQGETQAQRVSTQDRKERIKDILREKGQIGIKEISDIIKDVSEKSIQRDLNDLILSGAVVRFGERRWSTYKLS
jgi:hypothetical protein